MKQGVEMKECVGSANISLNNHVACVFGTRLFKSTVCIVLCCIFGIYLGFCRSEMSYAFCTYNISGVFTQTWVRTSLFFQDLVTII